MADDWRNPLDDEVDTRHMLARMLAHQPEAEQPKSGFSRLGEYLRSWGSASMAKDEPNWFGRNVLANMPEHVQHAAAFLPGAKVPRIPNPIRAYHGSPHDFSEFSLSKIGTGEGAQAYGHGLYFAEKEAVARDYRDKLGSQNVHPAQEAADTTLGLAKGNKERALEYLRAGALNDPSLAPHVDQAAAIIRGEQPPIPKGRMYEVDLHARPEQFLDWDKPLHGQSPHVMNTIAQRLLPPNTTPPDLTALRMRAARSGPEGEFWKRELAEKERLLGQTGQEAVNALGVKMSSDRTGGHSPEVADALREAGIPGIRYLDQGSRGQGQGTSNYVVWTPELIEILRKYGIAAPVAAPALVNALSDNEHGP